MLAVKHIAFTAICITIEMNTPASVANSLTNVRKVIDITEKVYIIYLNDPPKIMHRSTIYRESVCNQCNNFDKTTLGGKEL